MEQSLLWVMAGAKALGEVLGVVRRVWPWIFQRACMCKKTNHTVESACNSTVSILIY